MSRNTRGCVLQRGMFGFGQNAGTSLADNCTSGISFSSLMRNLVRVRFYVLFWGRGEPAFTPVRRGIYLTADSQSAYFSFLPLTISKKALCSFSVIGPRRPSPIV